MGAINAVLIAVVAIVVVVFLLILVSRMVRARRPQPSAPREEVPITVLPKTSLGRWSLGLAIAFIVLFVVAVIPLRDQWGMNENGELLNPALTIVLTIIIVGTAVAALVTGFIGAIKRKDRSVLVLLGMLVAFWWGVLGAVGAFLI